MQLSSFLVCFLFFSFCSGNSRFVSHSAVFGALAGCCSRWGLPGAEPRTQVTALDPLVTPCPQGLEHRDLPAAPTLPPVPQHPQLLPAQLSRSLGCRCRASPVSLLRFSPPAQFSAVPPGSLASPYHSARASLNCREQMSAGALLMLFGFVCGSKGFSCHFKQALTVFQLMRCSVFFVILY